MKLKLKMRLWYFQSLKKKSSNLSFLCYFIRIYYSKIRAIVEQKIFPPLIFSLKMNSKILVKAGKKIQKKVLLRNGNGIDRHNWYTKKKKFHINVNSQEEFNINVGDHYYNLFKHKSKIFNCLTIQITTTTAINF